MLKKYLVLLKVWLLVLLAVLEQTILALFVLALVASIYSNHKKNTIQANLEQN